MNGPILNGPTSTIQILNAQHHITSHRYQHMSLYKLPYSKYQSLITSHNRVKASKLTLFITCNVAQRAVNSFESIVTSTIASQPAASTHQLSPCTVRSVMLSSVTLMATLSREWSILQLGANVAAVVANVMSDLDIRKAMIAWQSAQWFFQCYALVRWNEQHLAITWLVCRQPWPRLYRF